MRSAIPTPAEPVEIKPDGTRRPVIREWVPEAPVALEFNGLAYAVMMATPRDLEDFARGFALTEGLARSPADLSDLAVAEVDNGWIVRATLSGLGIEQLTERVRTRVAESSCGLCRRSLRTVRSPEPRSSPRSLRCAATSRSAAPPAPPTPRRSATRPAKCCTRVKTSAATTRWTS